MKGNQASQHILDDEMADYFHGALPEEREFEIDVHLAHCDDCTQQARAFQALRETVHQWTAESHGRAYSLRAALAALGRDPANTSLRNRLDGWRERASAAVEGLVRVALDTRTHVRRIVAEGADALLSPGPMWPQAQPAIIRTRGAVRTRGALPRATPPAVSVTGDEHSLTVMLGEIRGHEPPLVIAIPVNDPGKAIVKTLEWSEAAQRWSARFPILVPGDYRVAFEPRVEAKPRRGPRT